MQHYDKSADVVIVGGGVIGCAIAYSLSKEGMSVILVERGQLGGKASGVAAGLLAPSGQIKEEGPFAELATRSVQLFPSLAEELQEATGINIEYNPCGSLRLAFSEEEAQRLQERMPLQRKLGFQMEWLNPDEVSKLEPAATRECLGGAYCVGEAQVSAQKLIAAYAEGARRNGAEFYQGQMLHAQWMPPWKGHSLSYVEIIGNPRKKFRAKYIVIATGAWADVEARQHGLNMPLIPIKGQIATIRNLVPQPRTIVFGGEIYIAAKSKNDVVVGATSENTGFDEQPTIGGLLTLFNEAVKVVPHIASAKMRVLKAGIRSKTPDKLPVIGSLSKSSNILFAVGHYSNGILFSRLTGQIIRDILSGKEPCIDYEIYNISRFN